MHSETVDNLLSSIPIIVLVFACVGIICSFKKENIEVDLFSSSLAQEFIAGVWT